MEAKLKGNNTTINEKIRLLGKEKITSLRVSEPYSPLIDFCNTMFATIFLVAILTVLTLLGICYQSLVITGIFLVPLIALFACEYIGKKISKRRRILLHENGIAVSNAKDGRILDVFLASEGPWYIEVRPMENVLCIKNDRRWGKIRICQGEEEETQCLGGYDYCTEIFDDISEILNKK